MGKSEGLFPPLGESSCIDGKLETDKTSQKDTLDCLYLEGQKGEGKMMTVLLHPHIIGRAGRIAWFEK
jgi:hypothetical protein